MYYLSAEFLMGRSLLNTVQNLGLAGPYSEAVKRLGYDLEASTLQLLMWQPEIVGVAYHILDCFQVLGALDDAPDDALTSSSSALAAG